VAGAAPCRLAYVAQMFGKEKTLAPRKGACFRKAGGAGAGKRRNRGKRGPRDLL